jgi:hypothetical protein
MKADVAFSCVGVMGIALPGVAGQSLLLFPSTKRPTLRMERPRLSV